LTEYNEALKAYLPDDKVKLKLQSNGMLKEFDVVFDEDTSSGGEVVQAADGSYIDSDQGKTGIGDSHFGWSMKYPAGLIKADQSEDGSSVTFADSKGEFAVSIIIQEKQSADLSPYALLRRLGATQYGTTVLEKRYVDGGSHPYAKLVGKRESGEYYEIRSFLKEDRMYFVILAVEKEENYSSSFKRNGYNNLLDSFVLGYDAKDESLKDISVFQTKNTITTEYGVAFDIPEEWSEDQYGDGFSYASKDGEKSLSLKISSAASGDTLKAWSEREERDFAARFGADYREIAGAKETEVGGTHALTNRFSSTMGDKWKSTDVWYVIKDKMKVEFRLNYPTMSDAEEIKKLAAGLTESVQFRKEEMNGSIGFIQDEDELFNPDETATYTSKKYKYTIQAPEYWSTGLDRDVDTGTKSYSFEGGSLSINADDRTGLEEAINNIDKEHKKNAENDANYVVTATDEDMFGTSVKKFELHYRTRNIPYVQQEYVFSIGGITYTIKARINEAVKTEAMWNRLDNTIRTFASSEQ
jgi:hypothetical protein